MKAIITWQRGLPDTTLGDKLIVTQTYHSFNKEEIDNLEQHMQCQYGNGTVVEYEVGNVDKNGGEK